MILRIWRGHKIKHPQNNIPSQNGIVFRLTVKVPGCGSCHPYASILHLTLSGQRFDREAESVKEGELGKDTNSVDAAP